MEDEIPDTKCKEIYCEVCRHSIKKLGWAKHLKTKKYIENEKGVEEVEKKQCRKCGCWRALELYRGENATCNICLGYRESWAKKNAEKVRDMNRNYWAEHREEKKAYNKEYSQREKLASQTSRTEASTAEMLALEACNMCCCLTGIPKEVCHSKRPGNLKQ